MMVTPPATDRDAAIYHATPTVRQLAGALATSLRSGRRPRHHARALIQLSMTLAIACVILSCTPAPQAPRPDDLAGPICIAYDESKRKVQCGAPPDAFSGDNCTCVDSTTGETYLGRVHGGL